MASVTLIKKRESMYYHLRDHIYITQFRDELILLDTKIDKYTICFKEFSELLNEILENNTASLSQSSQNLAFTQKLLDDNVIEGTHSSYPFQIDKKIKSDGVSNVDWRLPLENKKISLNIQVLKALFTLIKVNLYIKIRGLYPTIQLIKKSRKNQVQYLIPTEEELNDLARIVNTACFLHPTRIKCLEWAMTFVLLALKRRWKCNLEIGVQNYPFFAHAWVECDGKVVMDSQYLREDLAIILNEPFRRLKI